MTTIGDENALSAMSPWTETITVEGDSPQVQLSANGTGCLGTVVPKPTRRN